MRKLLILGAIVIVLAIAIFLRLKNLSPVEEISIELATKQLVKSSVLASGKLSHEDEVLLSTEVIGRVTALYVEEGDRVNQGQVLLQIDDEQPTALVQQQRASVAMQKIALDSSKLRRANIQLSWERKQQMHNRGLLEGGDNAFEAATNELELAKLDVDSRAASLAQAEAFLEEAEKNLRKTRVLSPINGVVTSLDIKVGEMAISSTTNIPGSALMTIADPASIYSEVNVDEADIANIHLGQRASIVAIANQEQPLEGEVREIAITAKQETGSQSLTFAVELNITERGTVELRPGMSVRAEIFTNNAEPTLAVPLQAVLLEEKGGSSAKIYYVYTLENDEVVRHDLRLGNSDDVYQIVVDGITEGAQVITGPDRTLRNLEPGDKVKIAESKAG